MMTDYKELYLLHCANLSDCTTKEDRGYKRYRYCLCSPRWTYTCQYISDWRQHGRIDG